jgi:acyl CoA:acetate/3-ketoacid CoA transferase alpha subunit
VKILRRGNREFKFTHPDEFRKHVRDRKNRRPVEKVVEEREAVEKFVSDGDYIVYDFSSLTRGPQALIREIIRQRKKELWIGAEFTLHESPLLVGGGCATKIDVGFLGYGSYIGDAVCKGKVKVFEWTNGGIAARILAGSRGIPFIPTRDLLGSDNVEYSGAVVAEDPFTGEPVCLLPALNPDVALIHVHQADVFGNCRIFGTNLFALEASMASKKVIVSTEEIVDHEEFRKEPQRTTIPYFCVDAVVHMPFGAYPGCMPGRYELDLDHIGLLNSIKTDEEMEKYLEEYVYGVKNHEEFLDRKVGSARLKELIRRATIKEGYR